MQAYSDPRRETEPMALPNVEIWQSNMCECPECGETCCYQDAVQCACPECGRIFKAEKTGDGWFYWFCFPGCLPDGDPVGPFDTEDEALADAQEGYDDGE